MSMTRVQDMAGSPYTETSTHTFAGGLACVLSSLALSPMVCYGMLAAEQERLEPDFDLEDSMVDWVQAALDPHSLSVLHVVLALLPFCCCVGGVVSASIGSKEDQEKITRGAWTRACIFFFAPLIVLGPLVAVFAFLDDAYIESIFQRTQICYTDSFASLFAVQQLDWVGLQPFADSVSEAVADFLGRQQAAAQSVVNALRALSDPQALLMELGEAVGNMSRYEEVDPSYYAECVSALCVLNLALGLLKLLVTFGCKAFSLFDAVRRLLSGQNEKDEQGDGTVQVHECMVHTQQAAVQA